MYIILHLLLTPIKACLSLIPFLSDCVCTYVCIYHVYIDCNYNNFHKKNIISIYKSIWKYKYFCNVFKYKYKYLCEKLKVFKYKYKYFEKCI